MKLNKFARYSGKLFMFQFTFALSREKTIFSYFQSFFMARSVNPVTSFHMFRSSRNSTSKKPQERSSTNTCNIQCQGDRNVFCQYCMYKPIALVYYTPKSFTHILDMHTKLRRSFRQTSTVMKSFERCITSLTQTMNICPPPAALFLYPRQPT